MKVMGGKIEQVETVLHNAMYCHAAFSLDNSPYLVPLNFGYRDGCLYFHSSPQGKKLDILMVNPHVSFSAQDRVMLKEGPTACKYGMRYTSVIGSGTAEIVTESSEKEKGLDVILEHYHLEPTIYTQEMLDDLVVIRLEIAEISYKEK
jgi:nitroimidazol reductase NimA-like FMN-containing flavoprotein (pyridoxamine 5'-phosphate oxidase superfamily)